MLAIEPMVNMGKPAVKVLADGWTAVTKDGSLSAHFEHTVAVTKDGPLVLTCVRWWPAGSRDDASRGIVRETLPYARVPGRDRRAAADYGARAERTGEELHPGADRRSGADRS